MYSIVCIKSYVWGYMLLWRYVSLILDVNCPMIDELLSMCSLYAVSVGFTQLLEIRHIAPLHLALLSTFKQICLGLINGSSVPMMHKRQSAHVIWGVRVYSGALNHIAMLLYLSYSVLLVLPVYLQ